MVYQSRRKVAMFTAMCLFCSMVELIIPKPVFIRIGFSNLPIMLSLLCGFSTGEYALLAILRIIAQGFVNGTIFSYSFILSLSAGISSSLVMYILFKTGKFTFRSISVAAAFVSNCAQIFMSSLFLGKGVFSLAPLILGVGLVTSFILGSCCEYFEKNSKFVHNFKDVTFFATLGTEDAKGPGLKKPSWKRFMKILCASAVLLLCFFTDNVMVNAVCGILLLTFCLLSKRKIKILPVLWLIFRSVLINVLVPSGRVLMTVGFFNLTYDSVILGIRRSLILLCSTWFSLYIMPKKDEFNQVFRPGSLLFMTFGYFKTFNDNWHWVEKDTSLLRRVDNTLYASVKGIDNDKTYRS